jgi:hypothetical protein
MPVGAPLHEPPVTMSGRADCASYRRRQPGQRLDQLAGEASNESIKMGGEGWLEVGSRSTPCRCGVRRRRRSKSEGEASWEGSEEGRKEWRKE